MRQDENDMSMEEILSSIRKYVTSDTDSEVKAAPVPTPGSGSVVIQPTQSAAPAPRQAVPNSMPSNTQSSPIQNEGVVNLTNAISDSSTQNGYSTQQANYTPGIASQATSAVSAGHTPGSPTSNSGTQQQSMGPQRSPISQQQQRPVGNPVQQQPQQNQGYSSQQSSSSAPYELGQKQSGLVSGKTIAESASAITQLSDIMTKTIANSEQMAQTQPNDSSITINQLIAEISRPIIKFWLDNNLPHMVESIVSKEIERIKKSIDQKNNML